MNVFVPSAFLKNLIWCCRNREIHFHGNNQSFFGFFGFFINFFRTLSSKFSHDSNKIAVYVSRDPLWTNKKLKRWAENLPPGFQNCIPRAPRIIFVFSFFGNMIFFVRSRQTIEEESLHIKKCFFFVFYNAIEKKTVQLFSFKKLQITRMFFDLP